MEQREISEHEVREILQIEESHFYDLKSKQIAPSTLTKSVSAFANASGGDIYIGVHEFFDGDQKCREWDGFHDFEAANPIIQAVDHLSPMGTHYVCEFLSCNGFNGWVLHLIIHKTNEIILSSDGNVYIRRNAQKLPLNTQDAIDKLKRDKGLTTFEDELLDIEQDEVTNSVTTIEFLTTQIPSAEPIDWLKKQHLVKNDKTTVACTLIFCDNPQAILPKRSAIKLFRYYTQQEEGERDQLAFAPITVEGPLCELIYSTVDRAKSIIEGIQKMGPNGLETVQYPEEALHETITNAVIHRDYSIAADIQVRIFDNRVEIESPGRLPGHITLENILNEQYARNPKIVRITNKFPNAPNKDVGEGLNTVYASMKRLRLQSPVINENENSVTVTLKHESLASPEQMVMEYLQYHNEITNSIARQLTGIRSENTMKDVFYRLRDRGQIEQIPDRKGRNAAWRRIE